ncbi:MAG: HAD family hydrolase [Acidimicrobiia bacterium]
MIEAVVFDLDDTLIVERATTRAAIGEALESVGAPPEVDVALEAIRRVWDASPWYDRCQPLGFGATASLWSGFDGDHELLDGLAEWAPQYRHTAWHAALTTLGLSGDQSATRAAATYVVAQGRVPRPVPGAPEALRLTSGLYRAVLTNGPADIQRAKIDRAGLRDLFDAVGISGALGVGKPDPESFRSMVEALDASPHTTLMIGDSWARDIEGAVAVGIPAVWLSSGRPQPRPLPGVTVIATLDELAPIITHLRNDC